MMIDNSNKEDNLQIKMERGMIKDEMTETYHKNIN